jgi:hypothetical protein
LIKENKMGKKGKNKKKEKQIKTKNNTNSIEDQSNIMTTVSTALTNKDKKIKPSQKKGK